MTNQEIDQKAAIMLVIEHLGNMPPGTRCSAVLFDAERIRREKEFHARLYNESGVQDPTTLHAMVAANVPNDPYWLVSLKPGDPTPCEEPHLYRVDHRTGKILNLPS